MGTAIVSLNYVSSFLSEESISDEVFTQLLQTSDYGTLARGLIEALWDELERKSVWRAQ